MISASSATTKTWCQIVKIMCFKSIHIYWLKCVCLPSVISSSLVPFTCEKHHFTGTSSFPKNKNKLYHTIYSLIKNMTFLTQSLSSRYYNLILYCFFVTIQTFDVFILRKAVIEKYFPKFKEMRLLVTVQILFYKASI